MSDTLQTIEATLDVTEETLDQIEGAIETMIVSKIDYRYVVAAGIVGAVAGGVVTFFTLRNKMSMHFAEIAHDEIMEARELYLHGLGKGGKSPSQILDEKHGAGAAKAALDAYQGTGGSEESDERDEFMAERLERKAAEKVAKLSPMDKAVEEAAGTPDPEMSGPAPFNAFKDDSFDLEEERKLRSEDVPYIITHHEFYVEQVPDYENAQLTYYAGDKVLVDEADRPMDNIDAVIGEANLVRFGSGSNDPNVVLVRNERLEIDYEITRSDGSYANEVLALLDSPGPGQD